MEKTLFGEVFEEDFKVVELDNEIILIPSTKEGVLVINGEEYRDILTIYNNEEGSIFASLCRTKDISHHSDENIIHILEYSMSSEEARDYLNTVKSGNISETERLAYYKELVDNGLFQDFNNECFELEINPEIFEDMFNSMELIDELPTSDLMNKSIARYKNKFKTYTIPVTWEMYGRVSVKAKNKEEALEAFKRQIDAYELPIETYYIDDSFRASSDSDEETIAMIEEI